MEVIGEVTACGGGVRGDVDGAGRGRKGQVPVRVPPRTMILRNGGRQWLGARLSSSDTPFTTEKTSFGRIRGDSRGIDGVIRGNVYLGEINTAVSCGDGPRRAALE